jgi:transcriptional regulator GlxA family with amidase domain
MTKTIAILALPGVQLLDVAGPLDVFAQANVEAGRDAYALRLVACEPGPIHSSSGVHMLPDLVASGPGEHFDTLLVAGAPEAARMTINTSVLRWLRFSATKARRYGSVCTGAFALAGTGLLDGHRVTTHWAAAEHLAQRFPAVSVEEDALYVRDGKLRTAAGVTAGLDLALMLVEEDLGREVAMRVAAQLVMFFKRPGGQLQFSRKGMARPSGRSVLQEVQRWVAANPALELP